MRNFTLLLSSTYFFLVVCCVCRVWTFFEFIFSSLMALAVEKRNWIGFVKFSQFYIGHCLRCYAIEECYLCRNANSKYFFDLFFLVPYYYCYSSFSVKVQFFSRLISIHLKPPIAAPIGNWTFAWSFCSISFLFHFIRSIENSFCCRIGVFFLSRTEILPKRITSPKKFQS